MPLLLACDPCTRGECSGCQDQVLVQDQWAYCACPTCGGSLPTVLQGRSHT